MPAPKTNTPSVQIGRHTHQPPAVATYAARQARRHATELERKDAEIAELREQAAKDKHDRARLALTALINERGLAKGEKQRALLFAAVERQRQAHVAKGDGTPFNAIESIKRAEHILGFNPVAPATMAGNPLDRGLPVPGEAAQGTRGQLAHDRARASTEAYEKRLRELGLDIPGQGTAGEHSRPF